MNARAPSAAASWPADSLVWIRTSLKLWRNADSIAARADPLSAWPAPSCPERTKSAAACSSGEARSAASPPAAGAASAGWVAWARIALMYSRALRAPAVLGTLFFSSVSIAAHDFACHCETSSPGRIVATSARNWPLVIWLGPTGPPSSTSSGPAV